MYIKTGERKVFHLATDGNEEHYVYLDNGKEIGKTILFFNEDSIYIDLIEVCELHRQKGWGTKMVKDLFVHFPQINKIWGFSEEEILNGFWAKQKGYQYFGEGHDEYEGYLIFEVCSPKKLVNDGGNES